MSKLDIDNLPAIPSNYSNMSEEDKNKYVKLHGMLQDINNSNQDISNLPAFVPDVSKTESLVRGAAQSATLGFADEITGAGEAGLDAIKAGGADFDELKKLYQKHRDESRTNYEVAQKQNPGSYLTGELAGGLVVPIPGLGEAEAAKTLGQLAVSGAKSGAMIGAGLGLGTSKADLTEGEVGQALKDTTVGTGTGLVIGGALPAATTAAVKGAKAVGKTIMEIPGVSTGIKAFGRELSGQQVTGKSGMEATTQAVADIGQPLVKEIQDVGLKIKDELAGSVAGKQVDITKLKGLQDKLAELKSKASTNTAPEITKLENELGNLIENNATTATDKTVAEGTDVLNARRVSRDMSLEYGPTQDLQNETVKSLGNALDEASGGAFSAANKKSQRILDAMEDLGIKGVDSSEDAATKMVQTVSDMAKTADSGQVVKQKIKGVLAKLNDADPDLAAKVGPTLNDLADRYQVSRESSLSGWHIMNPVRLAAAVPGYAGRAVHEVASVTKGVTQSLYEATPEQFQKTIAELQGSPVAQAIKDQLSGLLKKVAEADGQRRKALLFGIMQNPEYRKALAPSHLGEEQK